MLGPVLINTGAGLPIAERAITVLRESEVFSADIDFSDLLSVEAKGPVFDTMDLAVPAALILTPVMPNSAAPSIVGAPASSEVGEGPLILGPDLSADQDMTASGGAAIKLLLSEPTEHAFGALQPELVAKTVIPSRNTNGPDEGKFGSATAVGAVSETRPGPGLFVTSKSSVDGALSILLPTMDHHGAIAAQVTVGMGAGLAAAMGLAQGQPDKPIIPAGTDRPFPAEASFEERFLSGHPVVQTWPVSAVRIGDFLPVADAQARPGGSLEGAEVETTALSVSAEPDQVEAAHLRSGSQFLQYQLEEVPAGKDLRQPALFDEGQRFDPKLPGPQPVPTFGMADILPKHSKEPVILAPEQAVTDWGLNVPAPTNFPASAGPPTTSTGASVSGPNLPQLAAQIVDTLVKGPDGTATLTLSPEELGQVRLSLQPDRQNPDRIVVLLSFDRPDTMDLFRRHADQLTEALRSAGYAGVQLDFGNSGGQTPRHQMDSAPAESASQTSTTPESDDISGAARGSLAGIGTLDLRL